MEELEKSWFNSRYGAAWVREELIQRGQTQGQDGEIKQKEDSTGFVALLRACSQNKNLCKGAKAHNDIARWGLLEKSLDALVTMYAKCGALDKAKELLDVHKSRNVSTWTAVIAGYAQNGQGQHALNCFAAMQHEGLCPDAVTYSCVLKGCSSVQAVDIGEKIHDEIAKTGLLTDNIVLGNALVNMYVKCGALTKAWQVLQQLTERDVISWSALIAGYAEGGQGDQALHCFEQMQREGISPDAVSYTCALKACGSMRAADKGEMIHDKIVKQGILGNSIVLGNALIDMYAKCGALVKAHQVFEELPIRDVVSWTSLIAGYVEIGKAAYALNCFEEMRYEGHTPNAVTFTCVLAACGIIGAADEGERIHDEIAKRGLLGKSLVLGGALIGMYAKCGALTKARQVLNELSCPDVICWNALITGYVEHGKAEQALDCFKKMQHEGLSPNAVTFVCIFKACGSTGAADKGEKFHEEVTKQGLLEGNIALGSALVDMYSKCGALRNAQQVLEELPVRNAISWNSLILGYAEHGENEQAMACFQRMQREGITPDAMTYLCIVKACGRFGAVDIGEKIHKEVAIQGLLESNIVLGSALVDMYVKCGALTRAQQTLEELEVRNVVSWNSLIAGYAERGEAKQALNFFDQMQCEGLSPDAVTYVCILKACSNKKAANRGEEIHDKIADQGLLRNNLVLGTALIDMYAKCGALAKAQQVLQDLPYRDVISWTALIAGHADHHEGEHALDCYERMKHEGLYPHAATFVCVLKACGSIGSLDKGVEIHDEILKHGLLGRDVLLATALVNMYAKCGALGKAVQVLEERPAQNIGAWNALITGYVEHGEKEQALNYFEQMQWDGSLPDASTFSCVLSACSHLGRCEDAERYFIDMSTRYGMNPELEHHTCMVDLFGRAGWLDRAIGVIEALPCHDVAVWSALLSACERGGDVEVGKWAFEHAVQVEKTEPTIYVLLANVYAAAGMHECAEEIKAMSRIEDPI